MQCPSCSEEIKDTAKWCGYCGHKIKQVAPQSAPEPTEELVEKKEKAVPLKEEKTEEVIVEKEEVALKIKEEPKLKADAPLFEKKQPALKPVLEKQEDKEEAIKPEKLAEPPIATRHHTNSYIMEILMKKF